MQNRKGRNNYSVTTLNTASVENDTYEPYTDISHKYGKSGATHKSRYRSITKSVDFKDRVKAIK